MSFATASCDLWQKEQRSISSEPDLVFTRPYSFFPAEKWQVSTSTLHQTPIIPSSRLIDDIVYDSVFLSLLRIHDEVALHVLLHFIQLLARVFSQQLISNLPHAQNFARMNINVGRLAREATH